MVFEGDNTIPNFHEWVLCQNCMEAISIDDADHHAMQSCSLRRRSRPNPLNPGECEAVYTATSEQISVLKKHVNGMVALELPNASTLKQIVSRHSIRLDLIGQTGLKIPPDLLEEIGTLVEVVEQMMYKATTLTPEERESSTDSLRSFEVIVLVPIAMNVQEITFDSVPVTMDIGDFREEIAELVGLDPSSLVVRYRGKFCFPFDDSITLGELIGNTKEKTVQLTMLTKQEAEKFGVIHDYELERKKHEMLMPAGASATFMTELKNTKNTRNQKTRCDLSEFMTVETKEQVHQYIEGKQGDNNRPSGSEEPKIESPTSCDDLKPQPFVEQSLSVESQNNESIEQIKYDSGSSSPASVISPENPGLPPPPPPPPPSAVPPPPPCPPVMSLMPKLPAGAVECKNFHWIKLRNRDASSVWKELPVISCIPRSAVEKSFAKRLKLKASVRERTVLRSQSNFDLSTKFDLPDPKQSQNLEIMLRKLPPIDELASALDTLDEKTINREALMLMFQNLPRKDDIHYVQSLSGNISLENCRSPVLYVKALLSVPFWEIKLRAWKTLREFEERASHVLESLVILSEAMNFVTTNDSMRWILAIVLSVGNHMNQATVRGNALGFRIDALSKLITTKCTGENSNMLQFVVHKLSKCAVHCLEFPQQIGPHLLNVSRRTLQSVHSDISELTIAVEQQSRAVENACKEMPSDGSFLRLQQQFRKASSENSKLLEQYKNMEKAAYDLLQYLGLDVDSATTMFNEMYPVSQSQQKRQEQMERESSRIWDISKAEEAGQALLEAVKARTEFQRGQGSKDERQEKVNAARKTLIDWANTLELDAELSKAEHTLNVSGVSKLSEAVRNLFRLFRDFSEEFAAAVCAFLKESSRMQSKAQDRGRQRSISFVANDDISDSMLLEKTIDEAISKRRMPSPARSEDSLSSFS